MMFKYAAVLCTLALVAGAAPALAQPSGDEPRWVRYPAIAPDGDTISFTYRGQVFLVDAEGGIAVPITPPGAYSHGAVWSPDSERLAFASDINGDDDVFLADFTGTLQRLSWSSAAEVPTSFTPDGDSVLYTALRLGDAEQSVQGALSRLPQLYGVAIATGRESLILPNQAQEAAWNGDHTQLAYSYNPSEDPDVRQHRVAANARQIWTYDAVSGRHSRLFAVDGIDRFNPVWGRDGETLYYLSEASGWLNAWRLDLASGVETQLTDFEDDPVRDLSVADDGTIAFAHAGRIHVMSPGAEPRAIEVETLYQRASIDANFRAGETRDFTSSPDGERFALIANGDVFVMDREGVYRQVTATPGEERDVSFSPDGSTLAYAAQRDHRWGIYAVDLETQDPAATLALSYEETPLVVPESGNAFQPAFSPDGTKLAFIADRREVKVLDLDSEEIITLFGPEDYNTSYKDGDMWFAWSPTSEELLVQWRTVLGDETALAAIVPADGSARPRPVTLAVGSFARGTWSLDGTQVIGVTAQFALRTAHAHSVTADLYRVFLSEEARQDFLDLYDGIAPEAADEEEEAQRSARVYTPDADRPQRLEGRLTYNHTYPLLVAPLPDHQHLLLVTPDGEDHYEISLVDLVSGETTPLQSVEAPGLEGLSYVPTLGVIDFKIGGSILTITPGNPNETRQVAARIFYVSNPDRVRAAAFEQAWADVNFTYYRADHEGRDWQAIGEKYRRYLPSIASNRELSELISAMYGELSASHLFVSYWGNQRAEEGLGTYNDVLGVYLDYGYEGPGRRIADVLAGGPLARAGLEVGPGDIIASINGQAVPEAGGLDRLLDVNLGKRVQIGIIDAEGNDERLISVAPISVSEERALAHMRLIDARRELVERLSNGCIAYSYVPQMDNDAYFDVLGRLTAARHLARAAIVDVRSNQGGNLTRELITLLTGEAFAQMGVDGGPRAVDPTNRWMWPSAVVVDSFGYSDGSVFPQAYHDLGIGPIIGDTVLNTGTAVDYVESRLVPGLTYGIPVLPYRRLDGSYYENHVIEPDLAVPFDPNRAGLNVDPQLEAAVDALMAEIGEADCR